MKFFTHLVISFISSLAGVFVASKFIEGFVVQNTIEGLITVAILLAVINSFFKPIIKLIMKPFIILTLGLFNLVINGAILYFLDILSVSLTINGLMALIYATLIITAINVAVSYSIKH